MKSFKNFLIENDLGSLTIFDIDETLFYTTAEVKVIKNGKEIKSLSNQEFNSYKLKDGETFDFVEFSNAEKFNKESKPVRKMLAKAKAIIKNSVKNKKSKIIIITARKDFDDKEMFLNTFNKFGFDMSKIYVERAGNMNNKIPTAEKKTKIISKYLDTENFGKVRFFDDSLDNVKGFNKLKTKYPEIIFSGYLVNHDGSTKTIK